jgi:protein involved in polysaccharide export with SLBB domain
MDYFRRAEASVKLEKEIASKLRQIIQNPSVSITIIEYKSRPVSVLGEINNAGVLWLHGDHAPGNSFAR